MFSRYVCWKIRRSAFKASSKSVCVWGGGVLNPCGNLVQVCWPVNPLSEPVHSKAKMGQLLGAHWRQKKDILYVKNCIYLLFWRQETQEGVGVRNHGVDDLYPLVDLSEILYWLVVLGAQL